MINLEIWKPFNGVNQVFGGNANPYYAGVGLKGHTGVDYEAEYNTPIPCAIENSYCYSLMNKDNPDPSKFRAVWMIVETTNGVFEICYGHCNQITAEVGKTYSVGDILATVGNTGEVYSGGHEVTKEERLAGSTAGRHLHFQVRAIEKVKARTGRQLLYDGFGVFKKDGYYYEVIDYNNGYNGCIDPQPFMTPYLAVDKPKVLTLYQLLVSILTKLFKK